MAPHVKHMDIFIRTGKKFSRQILSRQADDADLGVWFVQIANNYGQNYEYTPEQKDEFRRSVTTMVKHAKDIEDQVNGFFQMMFKNSAAQSEAQKQLRERMAEFITDKRLLDGYTPQWGVGCRRITPGDPYMK
jgi:hypothetical protein